MRFMHASYRSPPRPLAALRADDDAVADCVMECGGHAAAPVPRGHAARGGRAAWPPLRRISGGMAAAPRPLAWARMTTRPASWRAAALPPPPGRPALPPGGGRAGPPRGGAAAGAAARPPGVGGRPPRPPP